MSGFSLKQQDDLWYGVFEHIQQAGIVHGVSTRLHGSSNRPFFSLNLGLHVGDDPNTVIHNRRKFCAGLGVNFDRCVTAQQTHGDQVVVVNPTYIGRGSTEYIDSLADTDALITNQAGIPLVLFFADCVPVLIADPVCRAVGIAHAGWKGTVLRIAQKTILKMHQEYGSKPADCLIGIGPSIGACCYEVDETVRKKVYASFSYASELLVPKGDKWSFNLWEANRRQLLDIGVLPQNIMVSGTCTSCHPELFYSYRQENGLTGRIGACITL